MSVTLSKLKRAAVDGDYRRIVLAELGFYDRMPDEKYLKMMFRCYHGTELDLEDPVTFSEKLQWLKLHDRDPRYPGMVDKVSAKGFAAGVIGGAHVIPTIGVYDSFDEIDPDALPASFVLKCTHDSGGIVIVPDKTRFDAAAARKKLNKYLRRKFFYHGREWPYKSVAPRIIAEEYVEAGGDLPDYKIHCFNGEPKIVLVCRGRNSKDGMTEDFYDTDWNRLPVKRPDIPNSVRPDPPPERLKEMLDIAARLSEGISFVRVDLYEAGDRVLFGEMTFYPASGFKPFEPVSFDRELGDMLKLPIDPGRA